MKKGDLPFLLCAAGIFGFLFLLSHWTPYLVDDFNYFNNWDTWEPLRSLWEIPVSMAAHGVKVNGRIVSHGLEQAFLLLPKFVFELCNAGVFTWLLCVCARICAGGREAPAKRLLLPLLLLFFGLWYFLPAFGQVCLWQVGALNYLWGLAAGVLFLLPFLHDYLLPGEPLPLRKKVCFSVLAVPIGMYTEITSFVVILMAAGLLIFHLAERKALKSWLWIPLGLAALGMTLLLTMPAELEHKSGGLVAAEFPARLGTATEVLWERFWPLCVLWLILMPCAVLLKLPFKQRIVSLAFALGALAGNYMSIAAAYFPERCMCTTALFLLTADVLLLCGLGAARLRVLPAAAAAVLILACLPALWAGTGDAYQTHLQAKAREAAVSAQIAEGRETLTLPLITPQTRYSGAYGLKDLDPEDPETWPNASMAKYYGVKAVLGERAEG